MKVANVKQMQAMDRHALETLSIPEEILMENAGLAATAVLEQEMGILGKRYAVVCGTGNNGGDGFVVARQILSKGGSARVFLLGDEGRLRGAAKRNLQILKNLSVPVTAVSTSDEVRRGLFHMDGVVDGLFGTGLDREIQSIYGEVIALINGSGKKVLSLDIPSGVHGDTGRIMGTAVKASFTVTFGLPKIGNLLYPGYECCGKLFVSHISFPPALYDREELKIEINDPVPLPARDPQAHKSSVGDCLFVAGSVGYFGAPYFSAFSFLKAGGGYSRLAAPSSIIGFIAQKSGEIVFLPQKETSSGSLALENEEALLALSEKVNMVVIGPGLSLNLETQELVRKLARKITKPILIDGDGITAIAAQPEILKGRQAPTVLTPHYGEMSRITGKSVREIKDNPIDILQETAAALRCIIVLKGAHSLIGLPDGRVFINLTGNSGMATAGSGDVLTGTIAAMYGLGLLIDQAVCKGVLLHGLAGDLAAHDLGPDGMTAGDLVGYLPLAVKRDRGSKGLAAICAGSPFTICP